MMKLSKLATTTTRVLAALTIALIFFISGTGDAKALNNDTSFTPTLEYLELSYNEEDAELLARLLYAECRGESQEGMLLVSQCVLDRLKNGAWGDTLKSVIYYPGQFTRPGKLTNDLLEVARAALSGERFDDAVEILYFRRTQNQSDWYAPYLGHVGKHAYYGFPMAIEPAIYDF